MINVNDITQTIINIGYEGENKVDSVQFDFSAWVNTYGAGSIALLHQRAEDSAPYPVTLSVFEGVATWTFTAADTQYDGWGRAQLVYVIDEQIKKSMIYRTWNNASLGTSVDPPEPWEGWVDEILLAAASAQDAATSAETDAVLAKSYAVGGTGTRTGEDTDNSKYYSEQSYDAAEQAISDSMATDEEVQEIIDNY